MAYNLEPIRKSKIENNCRGYAFDVFMCNISLFKDKYQYENNS